MPQLSVASRNSLSKSAAISSIPLGSRVVVDGGKTGTVRFVGPVQFREGIWVGVQLDFAQGKNDGSVNGVRYFTCDRAHGLFVSSGKVRVVPSNPFYSAKQTSALLKTPADATHMPPPLVDYTPMSIDYRQPAPALQPIYQAPPQQDHQAGASFLLPPAKLYSASKTLSSDKGARLQALYDSAAKELDVVKTAFSEYKKEKEEEVERLLQNLTEVMSEHERSIQHAEEIFRGVPARIQRHKDRTVELERQLEARDKEIEAAKDAQLAAIAAMECDTKEAVQERDSLRAKLAALAESEERLKAELQVARSVSQDKADQVQLYRDDVRSLTEKLVLAQQSRGEEYSVEMFDSLQREKFSLSQELASLEQSNSALKSALQIEQQAHKANLDRLEGELHQRTTQVKALNRHIAKSIPNVNFSGCGSQSLDELCSYAVVEAELKGVLQELSIGGDQSAAIMKGFDSVEQTVSALDACVRELGREFGDSERASVLLSSLQKERDALVDRVRELLREKNEVRDRCITEVESQVITASSCLAEQDSQLERFLPIASSSSPQVDAIISEVRESNAAEEKRLAQMLEALPKDYCTYCQMKGHSNSHCVYLTTADSDREKLFSCDLCLS